MNHTPTKPKGLRQAMSDLHIWSGLLLGWLLYAMFLTGTVSYFREEVSQWMRPELARQTQVPEPAEVAARVASTLAVAAPQSPQWSIGVPNHRTNTANAFWRDPAVEGRRGFQSAVFDPATGHKLQSRDTKGGDFFYGFHFQFYYMPPLVGRWIAGLCAMFMLVAIVSGVITHKKIFVDFFTFRGGKGQRSWLDAHNALSVLGLPFHLMITYTGLVTLMFMYMPWGKDQAFKTPAELRQLTAETTATPQVGKPSGQAAPLAPLQGMVRQAQSRWGMDKVQRVIVNHPNDAAARVTVVRGEAGRTSHSPQYLLFDGTTGQLLQTHEHVGGAGETRGVLYALHMGRFGDTATRWLYFLLSLAGTAMVGTGLVLWTVKRRAKLPNPAQPHWGFVCVETLNTATLAGLPLAMASLLWANRLWPLDLPQRAEWEIHSFFAVWAMALAWAVLRPAPKAWVELWWAAAALLAGLPVLNALTTERHLLHSLQAGDWVFAGVELTLCALAALAARLALRTHRHHTRAGAPKEHKATTPCATEASHQRAQGQGASA
jgi:uncharacterized iron-regulated membrane protein